MLNNNRFANFNEGRQTLSPISIIIDEIPQGFNWLINKPG